MTIKNVPIEDLGKRLLEELLLRAAQSVSEKPIGVDDVEVMLPFRLRADTTQDCIEISFPGAGESRLVTRLAQPFTVMENP